MNTLQKFFKQDNNKPILIEIVKLFHPDIESYKSPKSSKPLSNYLNVYFRYDWVCIKGNFPDNKYVDIGICFDIKLSGRGHYMSDFVRILKKDNFIAWRFNTDYIEEDYPYNIKNINTLFSKYNVPKPTAKEAYNHYYSE